MNKIQQIIMWDQRIPTPVSTETKYATVCSTAPEPFTVKMHQNAFATYDGEYIGIAADGCQECLLKQ